MSLSSLLGYSEFIEVRGGRSGEREEGDICLESLSWGDSDCFSEAATNLAVRFLSVSSFLAFLASELE